MSDCGKPDWVKMRYQIVGIENKRPEKHNRYHEQMLGRHCGIECLERGDMCWLWIKGFRNHETYTHFHTSTVMETKSTPDLLTIETTHSVYTLRMIDKEGP